MDREPNKEIDSEFFNKFEESLKKYISPIDKKLSWELFSSVCDVLQTYGCWCDEMKPTHRYRMEEYFTIGYPLPM